MACRTPITVVTRSVFISYSRDDGTDVYPDVDLLRAGGVKVYLDVADIRFGERWKEALYAALHRCERVMVFWSRSASASEWVEREWRYALELGKKIVPTLLDLTPLPKELAEFQAIRRLRAVRGTDGKPADGPAPPVDVAAASDERTDDVASGRGPVLAPMNEGAPIAPRERAPASRASARAWGPLGIAAAALAVGVAAAIYFGAESLHRPPVPPPIAPGANPPPPAAAAPGQPAVVAPSVAVVTPSASLVTPAASAASGVVTRPDIASETPASSPANAPVSAPPPAPAEVDEEPQSPVFVLPGLLAALALLFFFFRRAVQHRRRAAPDREATASVPHEAADFVRQVFSA